MTPLQAAIVWARSNDCKDIAKAQSVLYALTEGVSCACGDAACRVLADHIKQLESAARKVLKAYDALDWDEEKADKCESAIKKLKEVLK